MADPQQNYRNVLARLEAKDKEGTSAQDLYDAASFLPGTGEAIAAYELPDILSQSGKMMQSKDFLEAAGGTALGTLGIASVLPVVGPAAKTLRKGLEGFIPYIGPKMATDGPDSSVLAMTDFEPPKGGAKAVDDIDLGSGSLFAPQSKKGRQLLILSCSETKCPDVGDMKAVDRYLGPVFQSLKKQGVKDNVDVAILSAKHGLIRSDTKVKDYDQLMDTNRASEFKKSPDQMDRIKNTLDGYDKVVVQGGKNYKDVIRAASGDANVTEIPPGRGIGDQRRSVRSALAFSKIDTPVYHYTLNPGFTKFDRSKLAFYDFGPHVASTPRAAEDRFVSQVGGVRSQDDEIVFKESPFIKGDKEYKGGSVPLQANLSKPFLNPKTNKPFTESELIDFKAAEVNKILKGKGSKTTFTRNDLLLETSSIPTSEIRSYIEKISKDLAGEGFTHVPYFNAYEDKGKLSFEMLVFDRPKGSTKVLQSPSAAKDPDKFDDPDFMMQEGGVVSLKDRAVNMTRRPQGIEPFIKFVV